MSDIDTGAAPAAADTSAASSDQVVQTPKPISTESQQAPKQEEQPREKPSAREALAKAREKVAEQEKTDTKAVKSAPQQADTKQADSKTADTKAADKQSDTGKTEKNDNRDERGQYKAKDAQADAQQQTNKADQSNQQQVQKPRYEAPKRFSSDTAATTDWDKVPESVQAAVHRVHREMEEGITKYKASHDRYENLREFDEVAKSNGHDLRASLQKVVAIEQAFARNPAEGFHQICDHFGLNAREVAAKIAGMKPEEVQVQQEGTISDLKREIASLKEQVSGVSNGFQQQQHASVSKEIEAFASQPEYSRFYDLMGDVAFFLKSDKISPDLPPMDRLKEAYALADRLNPDPNAQITKPAPASDAVAAKASDANAEALAAQTRKGEKSITGAPNAGSDLADREPSPTVSAALKRAFAQAG